MKDVKSYVQESVNSILQEMDIGRITLTIKLDSDIKEFMSIKYVDEYNQAVLKISEKACNIMREYFFHNVVPLNSKSDISRKNLKRSFDMALAHEMAHLYTLPFTNSITIDESEKNVFRREHEKMVERISTHLFKIINLDNINNKHIKYD